MPLYTVLGNHDVKGDGEAMYTRLIRKDSYYSFVQKGYRFIGLDSSSGSLDAAQVDWLRRELATSEPKFVFMHIPLFDPRAGGDHCFSDTSRLPNHKDVQHVQGIGGVQWACTSLPKR